ncbi:MAG: oligosaccharide flippase family protein, partial [Halobacteriota archaeon]
MIDPTDASSPSDSDEDDPPRALDPRETDRSAAHDDSHVTLARQSGITFVGDIVKKTFGFAIVAIITRLVSPSVYGLFVLATSIILFVQVFATLGLPKAIDYYVPQYLSSGRTDKVRGVFLQVVLFVTVISTAVGVGLFLTASIVSELFGEPSLRLALVLLSVALPMLAMYNVLLASFNAIKRLTFRVYVRDITRPTVRLVSTAALLLVGFGLLGVVGGYVIGLAACIVVGAILLARHGTQYAGRSISWTPTRQLLWYSVPLAFASVIYVLLGQVDYVIVGYFLSAEEVGLYRVGYMLGANVLIFFAALAPVFKPLIAEEKTDDEAVKARYRTATRWVIGFTLPL